MQSLRSGISIIELVIVIFIGALLATSIGWLFQRKPAIHEFMQNFENLIIETSEKARIVHAVHKINLQLQQRQIIAGPLTGKGTARELHIPPSVELQDFLIEGKSQFTGGGSKVSAHFYINPDGIAQDVLLVFIDHDAQDQPGQQGVFRYQLNPFTAQFARI